MLVVTERLLFVMFGPASTIFVAHGIYPATVQLILSTYECTLEGKRCRGIGTEIGTEIDLSLKASPFQNHALFELQLLSDNEAVASRPLLGSRIITFTSNASFISLGANSRARAFGRWCLLAARANFPPRGFGLTSAFLIFVLALSLLAIFWESMQWEHIWDPRLGKGPFRALFGPSVKVDDIW